MSNKAPEKFDFTAATWAFVRGRFAFQAKQLRRVTNQPTAQCYDLLALGHGFSTWRGMSNVLDAVMQMERWTDEYDPESGSPSSRSVLAARMCTALSQQADDFMEEENFHLNGRRIESVLGKLPPPATDYVEIHSGMCACYDLREWFFYMASWLGAAPIWSETMSNVADDFYVRLKNLWDGNETLAEAATTAIYGATTENYWRHKFDKRSLINYDSQVRKFLSGKSSNLSSICKEAYRRSSDGECLNVAEWRRLLIDAHPRGLDGRLDGGPITALVCANGSEDSFICIDSNFEPTVETIDHLSNGFIAGWRGYAPTPEKAAQLAACSSLPPSFELLSKAKAIDEEVPNLAGYWKVEWL